MNYMHISPFVSLLYVDMHLASSSFRSRIIYCKSTVFTVSPDDCERRLFSECVDIPLTWVICVFLFAVSYENWRFRYYKQEDGTG